MKTMKKLSCVILSLLMAVAMPVAAMAADFTPSVQAKLAPEVVEQTVNVEGAESLTLTVTPVSSSATAPAAVQEALDAAYEELATAEDVSTVIPNLGDVLTSANIEAPASSAVVTDVFDLSLIDENGEQRTLNEGESVTVSVNYTYDTVNFDLVVAHKNTVSGQWEALPSENVVTGDGTVTLTFDQLCPVAFMLLPKAASAPQTIDYTGYIFCGLALAAAGTVIGVAVKSKKKEN